MEQQNNTQQKRSAKMGSMTFVIAALVLAIVLLLNILLSITPVSFTEFDLTASRLYTLTDTTKNILKDLKNPVSIYVICESGQEDPMLQTTLDRYKAASSQISVTYVDPLLQPEAVQNLTNGELVAFLDSEDQIVQNSMVIVGANRHRAVYYDELGYTEYTPEEMANAILTGTTAQGISYYNAECIITAAIDYANATVIPNYYVLIGHEEKELPAGLVQQIGLANIHLAELDMMTATKIPDDADGIIINNPSQDYNSAQIDLIEDFLQKGGDLFLFTSYSNYDNIPNLRAMMQQGYGVTAEKNVVYGTDSNYTLLSNHYFILPQVIETTVGAPIRVLLPHVHTLTIAQKENLPEGVSVQPLFQTVKDTASLKSAVNDEVLDSNGEYVIGAAIATQTASKIIWIPTEYYIGERTLSNGLTPDQSVSGNNYRYLLGALEWASGANATIAIDAVRLTPSALVVSQNDAVIWTVVLAVVLPGGILTAGLLYQRARRKRQ